MYCTLPTPIPEDHCMSPTFQMNIMRPPISKNIYFFKSVYVFVTFLHWPKMHIKFNVLCRGIFIIQMTKSANKLNWMVKTLKTGDLRAQGVFFGITGDDHR